MSTYAIPRRLPIIWQSGQELNKKAKRGRKGVKLEFYFAATTDRGTPALRQPGAPHAPAFFFISNIASAIDCNLLSGLSTREGTTTGVLHPTTTPAKTTLTQICSAL